MTAPIKPPAGTEAMKPATKPAARKKATGAAGGHQQPHPPVPQELEIAGPDDPPPPVPRQAGQVGGRWRRGAFGINKP